MIEAKTSDGLPSQESISKLATRLFVLGFAPAIIRWPAQRPPTTPYLTARRCQVYQREAAGGPRPAQDKGRGLFSQFKRCEHSAGLHSTDGGLAALSYIASMCGRATYKLTWEEIVALYRLTLGQPAVNTR